MLRAPEVFAVLPFFQLAADIAQADLTAWTNAVAHNWRAWCSAAICARPPRCAVANRMSFHSRTRRMLTKFWRSNCSYWRFDSLCVVACARPELGRRAFCSVSPARFAGSSLTCAERPAYPNSWHRWSRRTAPRIVNPLPQLQVARELALLVVKLLVRRIGLLLRLHRPVAHVLHAKAPTQSPAPRPAPRANAPPAACAPRAGPAAVWTTHCPKRRQFIGIVHRAQLIEQLVAIGNRPATGPLQKRKVLDDAQVQRLHPQDDAGQRGTQNFGRRETLAARQSPSGRTGVCRCRWPRGRNARHAGWRRLWLIGSTSNCSTLLRKL